MKTLSNMNSKFITYHDPDNKINILNIDVIDVCYSDSCKTKIHYKSVDTRLQEYVIETPEKLWNKIKNISDDFVKLHFSSNEVVLINKQSIIRVFKDNSRTKISLSSNEISNIYVAESVEKVLELLNT